jgi:hypothetical protein
MRTNGDRAHAGLLEKHTEERGRTGLDSTRAPQRRIDMGIDAAARFGGLARG